MSRKPAKNAAPAQPAYGISQQELEDYLVVDAAAKLYGKDQKTRRDAFVELLEAGATVEPGKLTAMVIPSTRGAYQVKETVIRTFSVIETALLAPTPKSA